MKKKIGATFLTLLMVTVALWAATTSQQFTLTVIPPPLVITTSSLPQAQVSVAYSFGMTASGGVPPYSWSATGLPAGLAIDPASGVISGTPTAVCGCNVVVTVTDSATSSSSTKAP